jgi:2-oxoglutarate ferredoxin oxidoreductase subunit beta
LGEVLKQAAEHKGTSFIEIYQNCVIFNPNEWAGIDDRKTRSDHVIYLEDGKPLVFGKNNDKGVRLNGFKPEVVELGDEYSVDDLIVHDESSEELSYILANMEHPNYPPPMGVLRNVGKQDYTSGLMEQVKAAQEQKGVGNLAALYSQGETWTV